MENNKRITADNSAVIRSKKNAHVLLISKLGMKKYRKKEHAFVVEGSREIKEALSQRYELVSLLYVATITDISSVFPSLSIKAYPITETVMHSLCRRENYHDAIAVFRQRWQPIHVLSIHPTSFWIALEAPKKPDNIGAVIRTAEACGAGGVILLDEHCDPYSSESIRASAGAIFNIPLVSTYTTLFLSWIKQHNLSLIGSSLSNAIDYRQADYTKPTVLLMGTELQGLSSSLQHQCDTLIKIPIVGRSDSLNLAVASGILLYQLAGSKNGF